MSSVLTESSVQNVLRRPVCYKIIASRNQKHSTALVTNVDFDKWGEYLSDGPLAMAFLDRLVEGATPLQLMRNLPLCPSSSSVYSGKPE